MIFIDNKYTRWYYQIITNAQARVLPKDTYTEKHHIVPECFFINRSRKGPAGWLPGNPDDLLNRVRLTAHEHWVCHLLLVRMTEGQAKTKCVFSLKWLMTSSKKQNRRYKITGRIFATIREEFAKEMSALQKQVSHRMDQSGEKNHMYGITGANHHRYNVSHTDEARQKIKDKHHDVSGANNPTAKHLRLTDPVGVTYEVIGGLKKFCQANNLSYATATKSLKTGKPAITGSCAGWTVSYA